MMLWFWLGFSVLYLLLGFAVSSVLIRTSFENRGNTSRPDLRSWPEGTDPEDPEGMEMFAAGAFVLFWPIGLLFALVVWSGKLPFRLAVRLWRRQTRTLRIVETMEEAERKNSPQRPWV